VAARHGFGPAELAVRLAELAVRLAELVAARAKLAVTSAVRNALRSAGLSPGRLTADRLAIPVTAPANGG
jgi:hypothetical protein